MASDADIISQLPLLAWGGLAAPPYDILDVSWDNNLAPRRIPYVDGDVHDNVGRSSFPLSARLYFLNTLGVKSPTGGPLFTEYWNQWSALLLDGVARDLAHPILGTIRARVKGGKYVVRENCRSGIIVDVSWVETVEDPSDANTNGYANTTLPTATLAALADDAMAPWIDADPSLGFAYGRLPQQLTSQYGVTFSFGQLTTTIAAVFNAITGLLFAANSLSAQILGALMGDVAAMIDGLDGHDDVQAWDATDKMIAFYNACANLQAGLQTSSRPTATLVTVGTTTLDGIAASTGNALLDIIGLNLPLLRAPRIPAGTAVTFYSDTASS